MQNIFFFFLLFSCFSKNVEAQNSRKILKVDLLLGGRWQSEQIGLPTPKASSFGLILPILPYFSQLNVQGFGVTAGLCATAKERLYVSFMPVLRYDYLHSDPITLAPIKDVIWDLHFNVGYKFKKNVVGIGYTLINAGKFMMVNVPPAPTIKLEFPALSVFYTRKIKKRIVAELKVLYNYKDFPVHSNPYNIPDPIYQRQYLIINIGCYYAINLL